MFKVGLKWKNTVSKNHFFQFSSGKHLRGREQNNGTNMMASDLSETRPSKRLLSLLVKSFE